MGYNSINRGLSLRGYVERQLVCEAGLALYSFSAAKSRWIPRLIASALVMLCSRQ